MEAPKSFSTKKILTFTGSSILTFLDIFQQNFLTFPTSHFWQNLTCNFRIIRKLISQKFLHEELTIGTDMGSVMAYVKEGPKMELIKREKIKLNFEIKTKKSVTESNSGELMKDEVLQTIEEECFASSQLKDFEPFVDKVSFGFS